MFILFQTHLQAQTKVFNDFGDADDFSTAAGVYFAERFAWDANYNIPDGTAKGAGELIHQETADSFWVYTDAPAGENPIKSRTITMNTYAEFYTTAIGVGNTVYLGIRYKDNGPTYYGGDPVYAHNGSNWIQIGSLGGDFDHQWKVEVIEVSSSDVAATSGKYRFKIGTEVYAQGIHSFLSIDRIELATTQGELTVEPDMPGFYPDVPDIYSGMDKNTPWYDEYDEPFFPIGIAGGWTGMSEAAFDEIATAGFNTMIFVNWMDPANPYPEGGAIWDVMASSSHYGFTEFLNACQTRGMKAIGLFGSDVKWQVVKNYFGNEQACLDFIESRVVGITPFVAICLF